MRPNANTEVIEVSCQCEITAGVAPCRCATGSDADCGCGTAAVASPDREMTLERIVMELDKRVRRLEASR